MKIITYNVNGIRAAIKKGFYEWLESANPDIICLQEVKAEQEQVETDKLTSLGYEQFWNSAQKKGYSGVTIFTKVKPEQVHIGMGIPEFDMEGRVIRADIGDVTVINTYFPSGTSGDIRQDVKYKFLDAYYDWIAELRKTRPNLIVVGDYNIAHTEMDIHNPKGNKDTSGFLPEERAWMTKWFDAGFIDSFRALNPTVQKYSWWSVRFNARSTNKGWRIDYISVSETLKDRLVSADLLNDAVHSDHCPVELVIRD